MAKARAKTSASPAWSSATITFGLVTVPVRVISATRPSARISFHLLHAKDGVRIKQQYVCPAEDKVVPRSELVRGYEVGKGEHVTFTDEELKGLQQQATHGIEVTEFVPVSAVDPLFFAKASYLAPGKGGDRAYALLAEAMETQKLAAVAEYATRGRDELVLLRAAEGRIVLHQLFRSEEIRPLSEVPAPRQGVREAELKLAEQLIASRAQPTFEPEKYEDDVRRRLRAAVQAKLKGGSRVSAPPAAPAKVIDLMQALQESLRRQGKGVSKAAAGRPAARRSGQRRAS
jgi:DNA end-binding protein Ku